MIDFNRVENTRGREADARGHEMEIYCPLRLTKTERTRPGSKWRLLIHREKEVPAAAHQAIPRFLFERKTETREGRKRRRRRRKQSGGNANESIKTSLQLEFGRADHQRGTQQGLHREIVFGSGCARYRPRTPCFHRPLFSRVFSSSLVFFR